MREVIECDVEIEMDLPLTSIGTAAQPCSHDVPPGKMQLLYECIHPLIISQCRVLKASHVVRIADLAWLSSWLFRFAFCLPVIMVNTSNIMVMVWFGIGSLMGYGMDGGRSSSSYLCIAAKKWRQISVCRSVRRMCVGTSIIL